MKTFRTIGAIVPYDNAMQQCKLLVSTADIIVQRIGARQEYNIPIVSCDKRLAVAISCDFVLEPSPMPLKSAGRSL